MKGGEREMEGGEGKWRGGTREVQGRWRGGAREMEGGGGWNFFLATDKF